MEHVTIALNPEKFDAAVHGDGALRTLPEAGDLAFYVKDGATAGGRAAVVITFTVLLPDGSRARAQAVTTAVNLINVGQAIGGYAAGGHIRIR